LTLDLYPDPEITAQRDAASEAARAEGIAAVDDNADEQWKEEALAFVQAYLQQHPTLFGDDLWAAGLPEPRERRALGPVILRAARNGWMEKSGDHRASHSSHGIPKPIWLSLIHQEGTPVADPR
jgi:hypothetical protein